MNFTTRDLALLLPDESGDAVRWVRVRVIGLCIRLRLGIRLELALRLASGLELGLWIRFGLGKLWTTMIRAGLGKRMS